MAVERRTARNSQDYSLHRRARAKQAMQKGLADAKWYASPIPSEKMRELLERRNGPAVRDTLIWFALLVGFGLAGLRCGAPCGRSFRLPSMACCTPQCPTRAGMSPAMARPSRPIG